MAWVGEDVPQPMCIVRDSSAMRFTDSCRVGARAHPFWYLGNSWADCTEIWCVIRHPLTFLFTQVINEIHLNVSPQVPLLPILGDGWTHCAEICQRRRQEVLTGGRIQVPIHNYMR